MEEDDAYYDEQVELPVFVVRDTDIEQSSINNKQSSSSVPDAVSDFILHFHSQLVERSVWDLHAAYESTFNKLTEKFYATSPWPEPELIAPLVNDDPTFLILYKELYFRHVYSKLQPTLDDRIASYNNYCDLFNYMLNASDEPCELELPSQWLWDIIDEFIYQFQSFAQYRHKAKSVELLQDRQDVWNVHNVLNVLYSLVDKSLVNQQLDALRHNKDVGEAGGEFGRKPLYRMLGYFSLVGLLRVQCMLGDYHLALHTMQHVELSSRGLFARNTACHVTTYYYVGFAYLMMRRYGDAGRMFATALGFLSRTRNYHHKSYQHDVMVRKSDQMYALLAVCVVLSPQKMDENINQVLKEKHGEHMYKMHKGDDAALACFEELFTFGSPRFISPLVTTDGASNPNTLHSKHQLTMFLASIQSQLMIPTLRSYLKLYSNLSIAKLAMFLDLSPAEAQTLLLAFKHKARQVQWLATGSVEAGGLAPTLDLQMYLKQDVVYIADNKAGRRVAEWFIRHINKFDDVFDHVSGVIR